MLEPNEAEKIALGDAGPLVRFAAERVKNLDPALTRAIAEAQAAKEGKSWSPQVSQNFWAAFNHLCALIHPTTLDCLAAKHREHRVFSLTKFRKTDVSLAEKTSRNFLWALCVFIPLALVLQLYVWYGPNESKKIGATLDVTQKTYSALNEEYLNLIAAESPAKTAKNSETPAEDERLQVEKFRVDLLSLRAGLDLLDHQTRVLAQTNLRALDFDEDPITGKKPVAEKKTIPPIPPITKEQLLKKFYPETMARYYEVRTTAISIQEEAGQRVGVVLSFVLPLIFGLIGAIAYVIRNISDQITHSTFSRTAPLRHLMRVTLGAIAGITVGFFTHLPQEMQLTPLALAFLAGYGVESIFSMFDGIIAKFKHQGTAHPAEPGHMRA